MADKRHQINLIPNKGETILNQFLSWALSIGRLLVIITETLALSVFFYRFSLDVKIIDLHDKIKQESAIIQGFKNEDEFRNLQARLASAQNYDEKKDMTLQLLRAIVELGRDKVTFTNIGVTTEAIQVDVQAPSSANLSAFTQSLKSIPEIKSVSIDRVENKTSSATIIVAISGILKSAQPTPTPGGR